MFEVAAEIINHTESTDATHILICNLSFVIKDIIYHNANSSMLDVKCIETQ